MSIVGVLLHRGVLERVFRGVDTSFRGSPQLYSVYLFGFRHMLAIRAVPLCNFGLFVVECGRQHSGSVGPGVGGPASEWKF